jgi:predicted nuclease of restriction endonuclease-like (RecB) superfamily
MPFLQKTVQFQQDKYEFIKNPSILEFLNLPGNPSHTENQIEKAIISNLHRLKRTSCGQQIKSNLLKKNVT